MYQERCAAQNLKENHHAIPRDVLRARNEAMKGRKEGQRTLDGAFQRVSKSKEFSRDDVLKAVAEFVVCDDQVSLM